MTGSDWLEPQTAPSARGGRPPKRAGATTCRSLAIRCDRCGLRLRGSASTLLAAGLPQCACGGSFTPADEHAARALDADAADAIDAAELDRLETRAARKDRADAQSGFVSRVNCGVCGRFKAKPADVCDFCGDVPTQHASTPADVAAYNRAYGARF